MTNEISKSDGSEKLKYPKSIAFIVSNEFCERFNYYGMRTILVLYMTIILGYNDNTAVVLFHVFTSLVYFFPLMGAIIADSFLGKYRTILYLSCVYAVGSCMIALGAIPTLNLPANTMTIVGLLLIGLGSGGIKPCVAAFGGDQFKIPEQAKQVATFFSLFYFAINAGSLIATYLMPVLRGDIHCFGELSCFSLAFGVPGILMVISIGIFVCGKSLYVVKKPAGNVIVEVTQCIFHAISQKSKSKREVSHWLDHAEPKYSQKLISDIKSVFKILTLFLLLPFFWALFDQQGSRWTFQATRMNGDIGFTEIKPDQMQLLNPLLILVFIPLFDCCVYPVLSKFGIRRPLQKLTAGGVLAGVAFLMSGFVELQLEKTYPVFPTPTESQMRIFNGVPCTFELQNFQGSAAQNQLEPMKIFKYSQAINGSNSKYVVFSTNTPGCETFNNDLKIANGRADSFFIYGNADTPQIKSYEDKVEKSKSGNPNTRVLANLNDVNEIRFMDGAGKIAKSVAPSAMDQFEVLPATYHVYADDVKISSVDLQLGGVYTIVIGKLKDGEMQLKLHEITSPNTVHMCWLIPQYIVMTAAEVMFSVTGLAFAYSQSPASMKSLLQASWLLTVAFGNVIVVIIAEAKFFESQAHEFFLFAVMMFIDMGLFALLAMRYTYVKIANDNNDVESLPIEENKRKTFTNNAFQDD